MAGDNRIASPDRDAERHAEFSGAGGAWSRLCRRVAVPRGKLYWIAPGDWRGCRKPAATGSLGGQITVLFTAKEKPPGPSRVGTAGRLMGGGGLALPCFQVLFRFTT